MRIPVALLLLSVPLIASARGGYTSRANGLVWVVIYVGLLIAGVFALVGWVRKVLQRRKR